MSRIGVLQGPVLFRWLVTGATRGIGRATAIAFAREGAHVVFCGRHEQWGEETANLVRQTGGEATFVRADVTVEAEVETLVRKVVSDHGRIDCAFNNAGFEAIAPLVDQTKENNDLTLDTNVKGVFFCLKHEARYEANRWRSSTSPPSPD